MDQEIIYNFDEPPSRKGTFTEKYDARKRMFGAPDAVPLWVADMDLPAPRFLTEALMERITHPLYGYTEQYAEVFDAIQWWMNDQHEVDIDRKWIVLSPSVVSSMCIAIQACTEPGDAVALLSPVYGPFFTTAKDNGRNIADCPLLIKDGQHQIDFTVLEETLARAEVKLLMFSNPHNPGGRVWSRTELEKVASLCAANGVVFFCDEVHADIVFPPNRNTCGLAINEALPCTILAHSIGKTFNTSGLLASFCIIANPNIRQRFRRVLTSVHSGDINLIGKTALAAALTPQGAEYKRQLIAYLHENTREVSRRMRSLENVMVMEPQSTFLVWCDFRKIGSWQEVFKRLLNEAGVALSGGTFFGPSGEGWFRINCAHPRSQLYPAIDRIIDAFRS
jgi:cystathionine beta-lyase